MIRKSTSFFIILAGAILFLFLPGGSAVSRRTITAEGLLVKFKNQPSVILAKLQPGENYVQARERYGRDERVEYVEPDYSVQASILPSDPYFNNQWYLQKIKAISAWDKVRESPGVVIAILDSGVDIAHPDLKDNLWINKKEIAANGVDDDKNGFIDDLNGWDFVNNTADPSPKFKPGFTADGVLHGTIIAGIAAAAGNNAAGVAGVTWKAQLMPLKVLDDAGEGSTSKVIKAIDYAIANGANIINLSFVTFGYTKALEDAVKRAYDAGVIVVAAGGNEPGEGEGYNLDATPMYPACLDGAAGENRVIGVAATDTIDQKAIFSSYGVKCIDVAAPGLSVYGTAVYSPTNYLDGQPFNKYYDGYWSGTSVAVPMVSAGLALISAANPALSSREVVDVLLSTADDISRLNPNYSGQLGHGRINLAAAVDYAQAVLNNKTEKLLVSPRGGLPGPVKITDQDGRTDKEFYAYGPKFLGGVSFASGDVDHDGRAEIITAAGPGGGPHVRIFASSGELKAQFFAFNASFRGGVNLAAADVNGDGKDEIIAAQAAAGNSEIRIFNGRGALLGSFYAYDSKFKGGLNLAAGDIDGDNEPEIVTGLAAGKIPEVRIFKPIGVLKGQFLAYPKSFLGGVRVSAAKVKTNAGVNRAQIITAAGPGGGPHVKIFNNRGVLLSHFFAFNASFRGGVNLAAADVNQDGLDEIIAAAGPGGAPHVRIFTAAGRILGSFYAYTENFGGGVSVGSIKINK